MSSSPPIRLTGLVKRFARVQAVDGLDLTIERGEVVALLGPNGAGKSTTIDLALGLSRPSAGTAELFGRAPREAVVAGRVGAMLQGGALLPTTTVAESVALVAAAHRHPLPVQEAMARAGVTEFARQRVAKLSGGQLQRARFAVAIVSDPELLVLDEPTAAMDVEGRRAFWSSMHELTDTGRTVVFATHYLDEADTFADRVLMMRSGRIVADGTPAEVKAVVAGRTLAFSLRTPLGALEARLRDLPSVQLVDARGERVRIATTDSDGVLRLVLDERPDAHDVEVTARTMDDAFLALTAADPATADPATADAVVPARRTEETSR
jgi:ABC-2 type transport system ATP-binding protein